MGGLIPKREPALPDGRGRWRLALATSGFLPVVDGVTVTVLRRVEELSRLGHEVLLFCPDYSAASHVYPNWRDFTGELFPRVRIVNLPSTPFLGIDFERNVAPGSYRKLLAELEAWKPDVIHIDEPERMHVGFWRRPGIGYARRHGIPCLASFHTNFLDYAEDFLPVRGAVLKGAQGAFVHFLRWVYNAYDETIAGSSVAAARLRSLGIPRARHVEMLGFDGSRFGPHLREAGFFGREYRLPSVDGKLRLLFAGRLTADKGWSFTIEAFRQASKVVDPARLALIVAGDGELRDEIKRGLAESVPEVHLLGRVPPDAMPALMANCDLHVTTSLKESRGLTVIEALASGIPVIAPDCDWAHIDAIEGKTGLHFAARDGDDFARALKRLADDAQLRSRLGKAGAAQVQTNTTAEATRRWLEAVSSHIRVQREDRIETT